MINNNRNRWAAIDISRISGELIFEAGRGAAHELIVLDEQYGDVTDVLYRIMKELRDDCHDWEAFSLLKLIFEIGENEEICEVMSVLGEPGCPLIIGAFLDIFEHEMDGSMKSDEDEKEIGALARELNIIRLTPASGKRQ